VAFVTCMPSLDSRDLQTGVTDLVLTQSFLTPAFKKLPTQILPHLRQFYYRMRHPF
jgi:hypothetical protein